MPTAPAASAQFPNGYTQADNWLFDHVLPRARPNTFKVVAAVTRQTAGWHRGEARLTFDDLQALTGLSSRGTLVDAVEDALAQGFVERSPAGRSYSYRLCVRRVREGPERGGSPGPATTTVQKTDHPRPATVCKADREQSGKQTATGPDSGPSSIIKKKGKERGKIVSRLPAEKAPPAPPAIRETAGSGSDSRVSPELAAGEDPADTPGCVYRELRALEPGIRKGETLAVARRLLAGDPEAGRPAYSAADIVACARFLQTDPWRVAKMVPLSARHVAERIGRWVAAGRPERWQAWEAEAPGAHPARAAPAREPAGFAAIRDFLAERAAPPEVVDGPG